MSRETQRSARFVNWDEAHILARHRGHDLYDPLPGGKGRPILQCKGCLGILVCCRDGSAIVGERLQRTCTGPARERAG